MKNQLQILGIKNNKYKPKFNNEMNIRQLNIFDTMKNQYIENEISE